MADRTASETCACTAPGTPMTSSAPSRAEPTSLAPPATSRAWRYASTAWAK
jgi:hypothetical protein